MRRFATLLGTTAVVALAAACAQNTPRVDGAAAPNDLAASASPAASAPATTPASQAPSSAPPSTSTSTSPADKPANPDTYTVTRTAIGPLKMGMSTTAAKNTGLVTLKGQGALSDNGCSSADWKNLKTDDPGAGIFNGKLGAVYLRAYGHQHTAAGISLASTPAQVKQAYPTATVLNMDDNNDKITPSMGGRMYVKLDGPIHFRFSFTGGKMVELALENDNHGCYE